MVEEEEKDIGGGNGMAAILDASFNSSSSLHTTGCTETNHNVHKSNHDGTDMLDPWIASSYLSLISSEYAQPITHPPDRLICPR